MQPVCSGAGIGGVGTDTRRGAEGHDLLGGHPGRREGARRGPRAHPIPRLAGRSASGQEDGHGTSRGSIAIPSRVSVTGTDMRYLVLLACLLGTSALAEPMPYDESADAKADVK